jgi:general secretion pathway protein K
MKSRDGYALVAALWFLVLVSALSLDAAHIARRQRLLAAGLAEGAQARTAAAAGIEHARARLTSLSRLAEAGTSGDVPLLMDPWREASTLMPDTVELDRVRYLVTLRDATAVLNVNRADEAQIRDLLLALRIDARVAGSIAQAILDWRDEDSLRRVNGAEREGYVLENRALMPRNGPFVDADEIRHVMGMNEALFARIRPYIGTEGSGRVNLNTAPAPVLASVPGMSDEAASVIVRQRASGRPLRIVQELTDLLSPGARQMLQADIARFMSMAIFETLEVEVASLGWVDGSPIQVRASAVLVRGGGSGSIMTWRRTE